VSARALAGDALALAGGALAAAYVTVGAEVRRDVVNPVYTWGCYSVAGLLLAAAAAGSGQAMGGFDARTWWILVALTVGPQLLGHSVFNRVLPAVGATVVSVAILLEVLGSVLLAWWWFDEVPEPAAFPAGALLLAGLFVVATDRSSAEAEVVTA
jgi:drug/metabolite transporter (DMT)-like permease